MGLLSLFVIIILGFINKTNLIVPIPEGTVHQFRCLDSNFENCHTVPLKNILYLHFICSFGILLKNRISSSYVIWQCINIVTFYILSINNRILALKRWYLFLYLCMFIFISFVNFYDEKSILKCNSIHN